MTAPTSDERREVAEQLREARPSTYYAEELVDLIKDALLPAYPAETWREPTDVLASLADLIDPTCDVADCGHQDRHTMDSKCLSCHASAYRNTEAGMRVCATCRMSTSNERGASEVRCDGK